MRKSFFNLALVVGLTFLMSSCYTYTHTVGNGPQTGQQAKKMNHYLIYGLAPISTSDPKEMAQGAEDYEVTITHTFLDGLLNSITWGLYTPTTTIVKY